MPQFVILNHDRNVRRLFAEPAFVGSFGRADVLEAPPRVAAFDETHHLIPLLGFDDGWIWLAGKHAFQQTQGGVWLINSCLFRMSEFSACGERLTPASWPQEW